MILIVQTSKKLKIKVYDKEKSLSFVPYFSERSLYNQHNSFKAENQHKWHILKVKSLNREKEQEELKQRLRAQISQRVKKQVRLIFSIERMKLKETSIIEENSLLKELKKNSYFSNLRT